MTLDIPQLVNWLVSGLISFVFAAAGAWLVYRYARRRDLEEAEREEAKSRQELLRKGLDNPQKSIEELVQAQQEMREVRRWGPGPRSVTATLLFVAMFALSYILANWAIARLSYASTTIVFILLVLLPGVVVWIVSRHLR